MSTENELKKLWMSQEIVTPDAKTLFESAQHFKTRNLYKLIFTNLLMLGTLVYISVVVQLDKEATVLVKTGIALVVAAILLFLIVYNQLIPLFLKSGTALSNSQYLKHMLNIKRKQAFLQTTILSAYFILLSLGIGIFMFSYVMRMSLPWGIFSYGITALWIVFNWFYTRPRSIRKQETKVNELILKFEKLNEQLEMP